MRSVYFIFKVEFGGSVKVLNFAFVAVLRRREHNSKRLIKLLSSRFNVADLCRVGFDRIECQVNKFKIT